MLRLIFVTLLAVQRSCFCADIPIPHSNLKLETIDIIFASPPGISELNLSGNKQNFGPEMKFNSLSQGTFSPGVEDGRDFAITPINEILFSFGSFKIGEEEEEESETTFKKMPTVFETNDELTSDTKSESDAEESKSFSAELVAPASAAALEMFAEDVEEYSSDEELEITAGQLMMRAQALEAQKAKEAEVKAAASAASVARAKAAGEAQLKAQVAKRAEQASRNIAAQKKRDYRAGEEYSGALLSYKTLESIDQLSPKGQTELSVALARFLNDMNSFKTTEKYSDLPPSLFLLKASKIVRTVRGTHLSMEEQSSAPALLAAIQKCAWCLSELLPLIENLLRAGSAESVQVGCSLIEAVLIPHVFSLKSSSVHNMAIWLEFISRHGYFEILKDLLGNTGTGPMILSHVDMHDIEMSLSVFMRNGTINDAEVIEMIKLMTSEIGLKKEMKVYGKGLAEAFNEHRSGDLKELLLE